jgi:dTDP-4-dehydrorhamnose 3,5-epimerase
VDPEGYAHGFVVLTESAECRYKTTEYWAPQHQRCLAWNDDSLAIIDGRIDGEPVLSGKDAQGRTLTTAEVFT